MKKGKVIMIVLLVLLLMTTTALASSVLTRQKVTAELRPDIKVTLDGKQVALKDANGKVVYAISYNGTTYLPVRALSETLGLEVNWNHATSTVALTKPENKALVDKKDTEKYITFIRENIKYDWAKDAVVIFYDNVDKRYVSFIPNAEHPYVLTGYKDNKPLSSQVWKVLNDSTKGDVIGSPSFWTFDGVIWYKNGKTGVETKKYGAFIDPTRYEVIYSDTDIHYYRDDHKVNGKHESLGVYFDSNKLNLPLLNK